MITVTFTELRNHAKKYFDAVEDKGETIAVCRHGKPVAVLAPFEPRSMERWKHAKPLQLDSVELSKAILAERGVSR